VAVLERGSAAAGVGGLQRLELLGGRSAVAGRFGPEAGQPPVALLTGAEGVQPLAGDCAGGADLGGQRGRVEWLAAGEFAGQVGVGELVADQPAAQLGEFGVVLAVGAQHPDQVAGEPGGHADLVGEGGWVDRLVGVDLTGQPGVGDPLPRWPRISRPHRLGLVSGAAGGLHVEGHRRPPSRSGQTTRAAVIRVWARSWRRWMRLKARSVLRPRRRSVRTCRRTVRSSTRWRRACSCGS
jgi:hypothetical protein